MYCQRRSVKVSLSKVIGGRGGGGGGGASRTAASFYSAKLCILFQFTLMLLKLERGFITVDLLNQNPKKKVMLLYKNCFN